MNEELIKRLRFMGDPANGSVDHRTIREAADALSRPAPAVTVPVGWALVPVEPTPEMLAATSWPGCAATDYEHMLAAAPAATVATEAVAQELVNGHLPDCAWIVYERQAQCNCYDRKKAVAQGGGVDVEKVMALVEEYGEAKWSQGDNQYRRGCQSSADYYSEDAGRIRDRIRALLSASPAGVGGLEPVEGDLLPPVGSKVLIHLASLDEWVEHTVTGYYVWGDLGGSKHLHRVFVRVVSESGYPNARMLHEVRPLPAAPAIANQEARDGR